MEFGVKPSVKMKKEKRNIEFENEMVHDGVKCSSVEVLLKLEAEIVFFMLLLVAPFFGWQ